ncbi:MAG: hypothetical protein Q9167_007970 [Letrouitia subvulpina]
MFLITIFYVLFFIAPSISNPTKAKYVEERHIVEESHLQKRQGFSQLVELASLAGIPLPTDPAVLLSLGPIAAQLQAYLPTPSVLSVLETAAPRTFLSKVVHDPAYAASFESDFAAGKSPSWFLALPSDVKSYLHTYSGYGGLATAVGKAESITRDASGSETGATGQAASMTGGSDSGVMTGTNEVPSAEPTGASGSVASNVAASAGSTGPTPSIMTAGAPDSSGVMAASFAGLVGILGLAVAL